MCCNTATHILLLHVMHRCPTCSAGYSRAYIHHLIRAGELLAGALLTQHNVYTMNALMSDIRGAITAGVPLETVESEWLAVGLKSTDVRHVSADVSDATELQGSEQQALDA
jgi:queuine/archaeosine tRNA-ribosyltransferase